MSAFEHTVNILISYHII